MIGWEKRYREIKQKNVRKCQMWLMTVMTTKLHCFVHHGGKHNYYYCQVFKFQCTSSNERLHDRSVCIQIWFCIFCVKYPRLLSIETIIFSWHKKHAFMFSTGPSELGFRVHLLGSKLNKLNILFWQKHRCFFKRTVNRSNWRQIHKNSWNHCRLTIST